MRTDVRCPSCGAKFSDGTTFEVVIPYKASSSNNLAGVTDDGKLQLGAGDAGHPTWFGQPELICNSCGHQWVTKRAWV